MRFKLFSLQLCLGILVIHSIFLSSHLLSADQPNVILIMTDDQGYGDLSITGNEIVSTPNMDSVGKDGAWMTQFYVSPVCTPTRAHLMTGRYNYRTRAIDTYLGRAIMEPAEVTLAEVLSSAGYETGIFGKWHLGDTFPTRSIDQGFTESVVHKGGGLRQPANPPEGERYHDPILFHNGKPKRFEGFCTDIYFDEAIKFIEKSQKSDKPFFAYIPTNAPHGPFDEPPTHALGEEFKAKLKDDKNTNRAIFYSMIKNIDDNIGRLLKKLKQLDLEKDTIVIFLTDNGPAGGGSSGPFRAAKGSTYQGGIRTVCFIRWDGKITPGTKSDKTAAHYDLMPTILEACNVSKPKSVKLDGRSFLSLIEKGADPAKIDWPDRNLYLQWHRGNTPQRYHHFAVIGPQGRWKLMSNTKAGLHKVKSPIKLELYDLENDIAEKKDVASGNKEIFDRMRNAYDQWFDDVSSTRDPNYIMPPLVIGAEQQKVVDLTPQDKRVDALNAEGWYAKGHWPVDVKSEGPYTIKILLTGNVSKDTKVKLTFNIGGKTETTEATVFRGLKSTALGNVKLPAKGLGKISAEVLTDQPNKPFIYQVTIK